MKTIRYAGGTFVTGDRIASALLTYAAALANSDRSIEIEVPTIDPVDPDEPRTTTFVIGPASQLAADDFSPWASELEDDAFVRRLLQATDELTRGAGVSPHFDQDGAGG